MLLAQFNNKERNLANLFPFNSYTYASFLCSSWAWFPPSICKLEFFSLVLNTDAVVIFLIGIFWRSGDDTALRLQAGRRRWCHKLLWSCLDKVITIVQVFLVRHHRILTSTVGDGPNKSFECDDVCPQNYLLSPAAAVAIDDRPPLPQSTNIY